MQNGSVSLATVLVLTLTGCGQLGGVCESDNCSDPDEGGTGGTTTMMEPGVVPPDVQPIPAGQRVVGYLPTWGRSLGSYATPELLSRLTHAAIAFAVVDTSGVRFSAPNDVIGFAEKAHAFDVKVLMSIGGASDSEDVATASLPDNLPTLVSQIIEAVEAHGLDGVDVDIEGSAVDATYAPLVTALRSELDARGMILSAAVGNWFEQRIEQSALDQFDFVSVMAYDACGSWTQACPHSTMQLAQDQIAFWVNNRGVPADRMVLGVPFYGYSWGASGATIVPYSEILEVNENAWQMDWFEEGTTSFSYNGEATISTKVDLGLQHGGVMIWDLGSDASGDRSLLRVVNDSM